MVGFLNRDATVSLPLCQGYDAKKLVQEVVNMDNLTTEAASAFQQAHTVFCTLGTTRKVGHHYS